MLFHSRFVCNKDNQTIFVEKEALKIRFICLALLLFPFWTIAQISTENSTTSKTILPVKEKETPKLLLTKDPQNPFQQNPFTAPLETPDPKEKSNMGEREKFIDPGAQYLSKLNRKGGGKEEDWSGFRIDQYLGDVRNNGEFVEIIFRDHESPDGDRIKIMVNDEVVIPNIVLYETFRSANIDLIEGFNKIDFVALNQGSSGPNTAEVRIYDDTGSLIASNRWNLATGVKATYIVVKE